MSRLTSIRSQFPALSRMVNGRQAIYFDGPAGSQVPQRVVDAISHHLVHHNANHGGKFVTSQESDAIVAETQRAMADLFGTDDSDAIVFGANMTTLTFALSRALATQWQTGDNIVVTQLDHDANVTPWTRAAEDRVVRVRKAALRPIDCTLALDDFERRLSTKTRLVAFSAASNAVGTRNAVREMTRMAHAVGALVYVDAVHFAPHALMDVLDWGCDFVVCSAYKFFGPHIGILWGKRDLLKSLPAYKVRPCPETLPDRWMTGTQNFACIAGVGAAVEYLASLGEGSTRRAKLQTAFAEIENLERELGARLLAGLATLPSVQVWGITDPLRLHERVPTVSFTHRKQKPKQVAEFLGERGIFVWHGNYYALPLTEALGVEPDGMVRVGLLHYNTPEEIDRLIAALRELE